MRTLITTVVSVITICTNVFALDWPFGVSIIGDGANDEVTLRWYTVTNADSYLVYGCDYVDSTYALVETTTDTFVTLAANDSVQFYKIKADSNGTQSEFNVYPMGYCRHEISGSGTPGVISELDFGVPFMYYELISGVPHAGYPSKKPSDIIHNQISPGNGVTADRVAGIKSGAYAYRSSLDDNNWTGALETSGAGLLTPPEAFTFVNKSGNPTVVILGGVEDNGGGQSRFIVAPVAPFEYAETSITWREARVRLIEDLELLDDGFTGGTGLTSDRVVDRVGGAYAYYRTDISSWGGALTRITPGIAYNIINKHEGNSWTYTYDGD